MWKMIAPKRRWIWCRRSRLTRRRSTCLPTSSSTTSSATAAHPWTKTCWANSTRPVWTRLHARALSRIIRCRWVIDTTSKAARPKHSTAREWSLWRRVIMILPIYCRGRTRQRESRAARYYTTRSRRSTMSTRAGGAQLSNRLIQTYKSMWSWYLVQKS